MLPQKSRINKAFFEKLGKPTFTRRTEHFLVRVYELQDAKRSRFAVSISKKIEKTAVLRNKWRRVAYREIANNLETIKNPAIFHLSYILKPVDADKLKEEIKSILIKTNK